MDDQSIVDLYWKRSEDAIAQTDKKYGKYCFSIAYNVLANNEDAEESVNDTYMKAWNNLPPQRPTVLITFLGRITRNISISRWRARKAVKRGGGEIILALDELDECIANGQNVEAKYIYEETVGTFRRFLDTLPDTERDVFLRRYFLLDSIASIAEDFDFSQSKVKSMLYRTRLKLRSRLEMEDLI